VQRRARWRRDRPREAPDPDDDLRVVQAGLARWRRREAAARRTRRRARRMRCTTHRLRSRAGACRSRRPAARRAIRASTRRRALPRAGLSIVAVPRNPSHRAARGRRQSRARQLGAVVRRPPPRGARRDARAVRLGDQARDPRGSQRHRHRGAARSHDARVSPERSARRETLARPAPLEEVVREALRRLA
jgi:hypothetical protein